MATETTAQRIERLEAELAELKAANSEPRRPARLIEEEGRVAISYPREYPIAMPTRAEYEQLLAVVERAGVVPKFERELDRQDFLRSFIASFERLESLRRLNGLDLRHHLSDWGQEAERWLHERGTPATTTDGSFFAAVVASGDIPYSLANRAAGIPARVGLTHDPDARKALPAWRSVLERGKPRAPEPTPAPEYQRQTSSVRHA